MNDIEQIHYLSTEHKIQFTDHASKRASERSIDIINDILPALQNGQIIEEYPEDYPNPSCLIFGYTVNNRILHIVAGCDNINIYIITAYYPDTKKFENDLKTRRKGK